MTACLFKNIKKIYHNKTKSHVALDDVSFDVEEGELYMITGPSRSGKNNSSINYWRVIRTNRRDL